jgi:hypothetical protein
LRKQRLRWICHSATNATKATKATHWEHPTALKRRQRAKFCSGDLSRRSCAAHSRGQLCAAPCANTSHKRTAYIRGAFLCRETCPTCRQPGNYRPCAHGGGSDPRNHGKKIPEAEHFGEAGLGIYRHLRSAETPDAELPKLVKRPDFFGVHMNQHIVATATSVL